MKPTKRDQHLLWTVSALAHLEVARHCREQHNQIFTDKYDTFMATGDIDSVAKKKIRAYEEFVGESIDYAIKCWQLAGRKMSTLRPYLQAARGTS